ncbi:MAG TPA: hypothetical protein VGX70_08435, partial [Gemmataceae bacterium]|nr:hypothetical protein [Gemmataceae bacterium]
MFKLMRFLMIAGVVAVAPLLALRADDKSDDKKGVVVEIDDLKSTAPANWKSEEVTTKFRTHHFRIPHVADDKSDSELTIFFFGTGSGGSADANVKRWKGMFVPPEGKKIDDVAKVENFKVGNVDVTYLDVQGTYKFKERPFDPAAKEELRPDHRMLGVVFESPKGPYFFRMVGPAKT